MEPVGTVRNATQMIAKQFPSSVDGQLVQIEVLVLVCCLLIGVLVLCNSKRRHESRSFLRLVVWAAFMYNDRVFTYTIGRMQSSPIENELWVLWGCFLLLLLLGSGDTVTAFNLEDSISQQTKSMANQGFHAVTLLLLILHYKGQVRFMVRIMLFLLWALCVVRLGLRVRAYRSTCLFRGLVRESQIMTDYMESEPLHSAGIRGGGTYNPRTMEGYIYLIDGEEVEMVEYGKQVIQVPYREPPKFQETGEHYERRMPYAVPRETVDVGRVWQCKGPLLASSDRGASRRKDLCLSFALFRLLKLRFATNLFGNMNFRFQHKKSRHFVIDGLLSDDQDLDRAFRVVEAELGFLFDFFYARYPSIRDTMAPDLIVSVAILSASIFTLFSNDLVKYKPTDRSGNHFIHGFNLDLLITRLVILSYVVIESYQFLAFIFSDWHKVRMMCRYVRNYSWHNRPFVELALKLLCGSNFTNKRWKGTIGQYFILDNTRPHWFKCFLPWISLNSLDESLMTSSTGLDDVVRLAVLRQLKNCRGKITDGRKWLFEIGFLDHDLDRHCMLGHTYASYILTWHVATSICSYGLDMENASAELKKNHHIATKLSGYCAYLLAFKPDLIPDSTYRCLSIARGSLQNARDYLHDCRSNGDKYARLIERLGYGDTIDHEVRYLSQGAKIAAQFVIRSYWTIEKQWSILATFWTNMMLYIAASDDRALAHARNLATGGEFITIIWALLTHAHVVGKLQNIGGAPALAILLEQEGEAKERKKRRKQTHPTSYEMYLTQLLELDDEYSSEDGSFSFERNDDGSSDSNNC